MHDGDILGFQLPGTAAVTTLTPAAVAWIVRTDSQLQHERQ